MEPAEQASRNDLVMHPNKDRRGGQQQPRRRRQPENPDADEFTPTPAPSDAGEVE